MSEKRKRILLVLTDASPQDDQDSGEGAFYKNKEYKQTKQKDRSQVHKFLSIHHGSLLTNKNILIFDDVMTSSHTLQAAIKLVEKYHPKRIRVLVLACPHIKNFIN